MKLHASIGHIMLFTTPEYFVLLVLSLVLYYLKASVRWQVGVALLASAIFYGWSQPWLLLLLLASASVTSWGSYQVAQARDVMHRRLFALLGVVVNLGILAFFKYAGLFSQAFVSPQNSLGAFIIHIPLPIGISFYTFQGISLMADTFREDFNVADMFIKPAGKLTAFGFYARTVFFIIFFPQLIAGPVLKAKDFMPQIHPKYFKDIPWYRVARLLITGYFLKCFCANNLHNLTFSIQYPYFEGLGALQAWTLLLAYSFQIFADFAGYSLIAIGSSALFGYSLPTNFNFPYIADSFSDFWRRWHISLSSWLRDYLYIPLGGSRKSSVRTYFNLFIVMALGGLWHGSRWSYMAWGTCHGLLLMAERPLLQKGLIHNIPKPVRMGGVFLCVSVCWLFFKLPNFSQAFKFMEELISTNHINLKASILTGFKVFYLGLPVVLYHLIHLRKRPVSPWLEDGMLGLMLYLILVNSGSSNAFIYFQF